MKKTFAATAAAAMALGAAMPVHAAPADPAIAQLLERLERLEARNAALEAEVHALHAQTDAAASPAPTAAAAPASTPQAAPSSPVLASAASERRAEVSAIGIAPTYSLAVLEHTEGVNKRLIRQLEARRDGELASPVTLGARIVAIADAHFSNRANKFGYLMRHPTANNQRTFDTQEMALSSVQLAATFTPARDFTGYLELLYDPEQSFGAGTITALTRNQIQLRKGYVMWGNLKHSPVYAALGKMDVPFGLQDSVSPFTNSTNWHAFAPLAYGGQAGVLYKGLSLRGMAIVGGAQFRGANTPVDGTNIPSKLNNFAVDGSYTVGLGEGNSLMAGASYLHGSAYCSAYPAVHFSACNGTVPAFSAYGRLVYGRIELLGDFAKTTRVWPGTRVPDPNNPLSRFAASKVTSFTAGGRVRVPYFADRLKVSAEFSKFIAGEAGAPWHRQDQLTLGLAERVTTGVSLFGEYISIKGFVPLNFLSGGNFPDGSTWSDADARSQVVMMGVKAGF